MKVEIITPESLVYSGNADLVTLPGVFGEFQVLKDHAPIVSDLAKGTVSIKGNFEITESVKHLFSEASHAQLDLNINSGTVEVCQDKVVVLVD